MVEQFNIKQLEDTLITMYEAISQLQSRVLKLEQIQKKIGMYEIKTEEKIISALNKEIEDKGGNK